MFQVPQSAGTGGQLFSAFGSGRCYQALPHHFPLATSKAEVAPVVAVGLKLRPTLVIFPGILFFFPLHFSALPLPKSPAYRCVPEISPLTSVQLWLISFTGFHKEKKIFAVGIVVFLIHLLFLVSLIYPGVSNTLYAFQ